MKILYGCLQPNEPFADGLYICGPSRSATLLAPQMAYIFVVQPNEPFCSPAECCKAHGFVWGVVKEKTCMCDIRLCRYHTHTYMKYRYPYTYTYTYINIYIYVLYTEVCRKCINMCINMHPCMRHTILVSSSRVWPMSRLL